MLKEQKNIYFVNFKPLVMSFFQENKSLLIKLDVRWCKADVLTLCTLGS